MNPSHFINPPRSNRQSFLELILHPPRQIKPRLIAMLIDIVPKEIIHPKDIKTSTTSQHPAINQPHALQPTKSPLTIRRKEILQQLRRIIKRAIHVREKQDDFLLASFRQGVRRWVGDVRLEPRDLLDPANGLAFLLERREAALAERACEEGGGVGSRHDARPFGLVSEYVRRRNVVDEFP